MSGGVGGVGSSSLPFDQIITLLSQDRQTVATLQNTVNADEQAIETAKQTYEANLQLYEITPTDEGLADLEAELDALEALYTQYHADLTSLQNATITFLQDYSQNMTALSATQQAQLDALMTTLQGTLPPDEFATIEALYGQRTTTYTAMMAAFEALRAYLLSSQSTTFSAVELTDEAYIAYQRAYIADPQDQALWDTYDALIQQLSSLQPDLNEANQQIATLRSAVDSTVAAFVEADTAFENAIKNLLSDPDLLTLLTVEAQTIIVRYLSLSDGADQVFYAQQYAVIENDLALRNLEYTTWPDQNPTIEASMQAALDAAAILQQETIANASFPEVTAPITTPTLLAPDGVLTISDLMKVLSQVRLLTSQMIQMINYGDSHLFELLSRMADAEITGNTERNAILFLYLVDLKQADIDYNTQVDTDNEASLADLATQVETFNSQVDAINAVIDQINAQIDARNQEGVNLANSLGEDPPPTIPHINYVSTLGAVPNYPPPPDQATIDTYNAQILLNNEVLNQIQNDLDTAGITQPLLSPVALREYILVRDYFIGDTFVNINEVLAYLYQLISDNSLPNSQLPINVFEARLFNTFDANVGRAVDVSVNASHLNVTPTVGLVATGSGAIYSPTQQGATITNSFNDIIRNTRFSDILLAILERTSIKGGLRTLEAVPTSPGAVATFGLLSGRGPASGAEIDQAIAHAVANELIRNSLDGKIVTEIVFATLKNLKLLGILKDLSQDDIKALSNTLKVASQLVFLYIASLLIGGSSTSSLLSNLASSLGVASSGGASLSDSIAATQGSLSQIGISPTTTQNALLLLAALISNINGTQGTTLSTTDILLQLKKNGYVLSPEDLGNPARALQLFSIITAGLTNDQKSALLSSLGTVGATLGAPNPLQAQSLESLIGSLFNSAPPLSSIATIQALLTISGILSAKAGLDTSTIESSLGARGIAVGSFSNLTESEIASLLNQAISSLGDREKAKLLSGLAGLLNSLNLQSAVSASITSIAASLASTTSISSSSVAGLTDTALELSGVSSSSAHSQTLEQLIKHSLLSPTDIRKLIQGGNDYQVREKGNTPYAYNDPTRRLYEAFHTVLKETHYSEKIQQGVEDFKKYIETQSEFSAVVMDLLLNPGRTYVKNFSLMTRDQGDQNFHFPSQIPV